MSSGRAPALAAVALVAALVVTASPHDARAHRGERIRIETAPGSSVLVEGTFPEAPSRCVRPHRPLLRARYTGTIEVGRTGDGRLFLIGELPLQSYLSGIAEVPPSWPMAALKAQAVAARSYALARLSRPGETARALGYDLCATDACQVYRGLGVANGPHGDRWVEAVRTTAGEVLTYGGRPAETLYFSTSNGRTFGNDEIFGSAPLPYLRPVEERDDGASSLAEWRTEIRLADVGRFLAVDGLWPAGRTPRSVRRDGDRVTVRGGGVSRTMDVTRFRLAMNSWGHCLEPDRYPGVDAGSRLPQVVPSRWFEVTAGAGSAVLTGRGWGHGVGMVQWGAYGKARRGLSYREILSAYYGGLAPRPYPVPARIRVGMAEGLTSVLLAPSGSFRVTGRRVAAAPWRVTGGGRLRVRHASAPRPEISPGRLLAPTRARAGTLRRATLTLPQTSVARLVLRTPGGEVTASPRRTYAAGTHRIRWRVPQVSTGRYRLHALVTDGVDEVRTRPVSVRIRGRGQVRPSPSAPGAGPTATAVPAPRPPRAAGSGGVHPSTVLLLATALAAVAVAAASGLYLRRRLRSAPPSPGEPFDPRG